MHMVVHGWSRVILEHIKPIWARWLRSLFFYVAAYRILFEILAHDQIDMLRQWVINNNVWSQYV